jgi:nucleotide-binding universal stress UspA family protein
VGVLVVGCDGSDGSSAALAAALGLARDLGDGIALVFGYAPPGTWGGEIAEHEEAIEELGERVTAEGREQAEAAGVEVTVELVPRKGPEALIEVGDRLDARMIVVGSHGEGALKGAILGSTTYRALHASKRPVLVVPATG